MQEGRGHIRGRRKLKKENMELREAVEKLEMQLKLALEAVRETNAKLKNMSQAAMLTELLKKENISNMSHRLRTPLNGIMGMSKLLEDSMTGEIQKEYFSAMREAGYNLLDVVNDLIYYLNTESGAKETDSIDLNLLTEEIKSRLGSRISNLNEISLTFDTDDNIPGNLYGDYHKLLTAISNIIAFTIRHTKGGEIKASLRLTERNSDYAEIYFIISDTAGSLTEEKAEKIFTPFAELCFCSNGRHQATGLEMPIARSMVKQMGGSLSYEAAPGKGCAFVFGVRLKSGIA